jgi:hypothetical protein
LSACHGDDILKKESALFRIQNKTMSCSRLQKVSFQRQSGSVLIIAVLMTSLFLAIGMTIARVNTIEHATSTDVGNSAVAYQEAEVGMEIALSQVYKPKVGGAPTLKGLIEASTGDAYSCLNGNNSDGILQSPVMSNGASFRIAAYTRGDITVPVACNATVFDAVGVPPKTPQGEIGRVKVWGVYKGSLRSIESLIVSVTP